MEIYGDFSYWNTSKLSDQSIYKRAFMEAEDLAITSFSVLLEKFSVAPRSLCRPVIKLMFSHSSCFKY